MPEPTKSNADARIVAPTDLLGIRGAAELLGIDQSNVRRAIYSGRLVPLAELGESTKFIFDRDDVLAYLREKTSPQEKTA